MFGVIGKLSISINQVANEQCSPQKHERYFCPVCHPWQNSSCLSFPKQSLSLPVPLLNSEGINDPSLKMNAISDGETVFQGGCTGSLVYCYVLLSILITPFTANLFRLGSHTHAALLPTSLTEIRTAPTCTGPVRSCTKVNWCWEVRQKKGLRGISESMRSLLRKTLSRIARIILPWALFILPIHHADILHSAWPETRAAILHRILLRIK